MGKPSSPEKVKLIIGFIAKDVSLFEKASRQLERKFSNIDYRSQIIDFTQTEYYKQEFGVGLKRQFISFRRLICQDALADIKIFTNNLENKLTIQGKRRINIDPGYISLSKVILATTKDFVHRIYLRKGIFAETTLYYKDNRYNEGQWTYPDYRSVVYKDIFTKIREIYKFQHDGKV